MAETVEEYEEYEEYEEGEEEGVSGCLLTSLMYINHEA